MSNDERIKLLLSDLGRATLRGIRKCPKCGTYNGTRGVSCKNKKCDVVFKGVGLKRKLSSDAVKLLTGTTTQVYSVRVRDRGPDHRGFVQLPFPQANLNELDVLDPSINLNNEPGPLCLVDTCQRWFDASILKCHESEQCNNSVSCCVHVQAAIKCANEATPLMLRNSILSSLNVSNEIKQELWLLATETAGPLVQRVSKNIMAVKCQTSPKHALGYLHMSFITTKCKDRIEQKYLCSCGTDFKGVSNNNKTQLSSQKEDIYQTPVNKCLHYYACICAFASDTNLSEEFSFFVKLEKPFSITPNLNTDVLTDDLSEDVNDTLVSMFNTDFVTSNSACNIEVLTDEGFLDVSNMVVAELNPAHQTQEIHDLKIDENGEVTSIRGLDGDMLDLSELTDNFTNVFTDNLKPELIEISELKRPYITQTLKTYSSKKVKKTTPMDRPKRSTSRSTGKESSSSRKMKKPPIYNTPESMDEQNVSFSFMEWLASVTEAINQTMHFQFSGKPQPLQFLVPQYFFECLRERISVGFTKKRLPNFTQVETRRVKPPYGTFTKYIWHITNIFHLKQIFETPLLPLEITRSFVKNRDGTFEPCLHDKEETDNLSNGYIPIKPYELKTYLKVGNTAIDQNQPTPFIIEWTPDIMPRTQMGEMNLIFEYGHSKDVSGAMKTKKSVGERYVGIVY